MKYRRRHAGEEGYGADRRRVDSFHRDLVDVVRAGVPGGPRMLRLDEVFRELRRRLLSANLPEPGMTSESPCTDCSGVGAGAGVGTAPRLCPKCSGTGQASMNEGAFAFSEPCRECRGRGLVVDTPCPNMLTPRARAALLRARRVAHADQRLLTRFYENAAVSGLAWIERLAITVLRW
jgi:hypothetical protein